MDVFSLLPNNILKPISLLNKNNICEIRIRANSPVKLFYNGKFCFLNNNGVCNNPSNLSCSQKDIADFVLRAAQFSIYAVNNQLKSGFLTMLGGVRIGVSGETVYENNCVKTQKNFNSLVVRIPHEIINCGKIAFNAISLAKNKNTLILSPPGCGKTTVLRDVARLISNAGFNTLIVDERCEIAACLNGVPQLNVGCNSDVISNCYKNYAFDFGIRSLRPDFIVTDELTSLHDLIAVKSASLSGVNVVASIHASCLDDIVKKSDFVDLLNNKIFGRFVVLSNRNGVGTYEKIYDSNLNPI